VNRQICCHKIDHRPLHECQHYIHTGWEPYNGSSFKKIMSKCGNLMHTDCIERFGKCHKNAGVKEHERSTRDS